jgi:hypothetical protein
MDNLTADAPYNVRASKRFPMNLTSASKELGISIQKFRRYLKILQIPVERQGYAIMVDRFSFSKVKGALVRKEVRRGRKKKSGPKVPMTSARP